jgi:hypothetical protein
MLVNYLDDENLPMVATEIDRRELERYFEYLRQRPNFRTGECLSHSCIAKQHRHLQQFRHWLSLFCKMRSRTSRIIRRRFCGKTS